jgi:hypothetical protein
LLFLIWFHLLFLIGCIQWCGTRIKHPTFKEKPGREGLRSIEGRLMMGW